MRYIKLYSLAEAQSLNTRLTNDAIRLGKFTSGTDNYCNPEFIDGYYQVPILEGYEDLFTTAELELSLSQSTFSNILRDINIGRNILLSYLADNKAINLTFEQSVQQLQKFQTVKAFLEVGNLEDSKLIIQNTPTDDVFTDERKAKYLAMFP